MWMSAKKLRELKRTNCKKAMAGLPGQSPLRSDSSQGGQGGPCVRWPKATHGGPSGSSPLRSDGSRDGQAGRLACVTGD
jgi:hypothetical protein